MTTVLIRGGQVCRKKQHAFTLIELLVVIAIIAILAAILFPVFARAKAASKAAASLLNAKQISLAGLMYSGDFDDMFMIGGQWYSPDSDASHPSGGSIGYMPWTGLIDPYQKSLGVTDSPHVGATNVPYNLSSTNHCDNRRQCSLLYPTYGYNMAFLSPVYEVAPYTYTSSLAQTSVASPASQVMLTEIWSPNVSRWGAWTSGSPYFYVSFASAEPPSCRWQSDVTIPFCQDPWGVDSYRDSHLTPEEGGGTGGVAFRNANLTPTAFADGHVKRMNANQLAVGTNWKRNVTLEYQVSVVTSGAYMWDPKEQRQ